MDWCRVVGPRGLRRPLDEKQVSNKRALSGLLDVLTQGRAGQSRAGQGRAGQARGQGRAGQGRAGQGKGTAQGRAGQGRAGQRRAGQGRAGQRGQAGQGRAAAQQGAAGQLGSRASLQSSYTGRLYPHRSDGTLGRGPRSQPRAPMQMVSGGLGFRVLKHDIPKNTPNTTQNFQPNPRKPHFRDEIKSFGDMRLCPSLCLGFRMA